MDLVTHDATVMLEQDQAQSLLLEMAAVVRTIFAVHQQPASAARAAAPAPPVAAVATAETAAFPGASVSPVATSAAPAPKAAALNRN